MVDIYYDAKRQGIYLALYELTLRGIVVLVFTKSVLKQSKSNFLLKKKKKKKKKRQLEFVYLSIDSVSGIIFLTFCCKFSRIFFSSDQ